MKYQPVSLEVQKKGSSLASCYIFYAGVDLPPSSATTFLGDTAVFFCSISREHKNILWYVNDIYVLQLPGEYAAVFMTTPYANGGDQSASLQLSAVEQTNNSLIQCVIGTPNGLDFYYFPEKALLQVQGMMFILWLQSA